MRIESSTMRQAVIGLLLVAAVSMVVAENLYAHGSIRVPLSRVYNCFLEGPESPQSEACRAAVAAGGTQQFYDWNGVNQLPDGKHREVVPDGKLCSAGKESHKGLDLARDDWPVQSIAPDINGNFEFIYRATAPHSSEYFEFYVTKDGYDPTQPLKWSDLEENPFCTINEVTLDGGQYRMLCPLPENKSGRHLIYNIWQRDDSPEAFYSCSDVEFATDGPSPTTTPLPAASPTTVSPTTVSPTTVPTTMPVTATPTNRPQTPQPTSQPTSQPTQVPITATPVSPQPTAIPNNAVCQVEYTVLNQWATGFTANVTITNSSARVVDGWSLEWVFPDKQQITHLWDGVFTQNGERARVGNSSWNATLSSDGGTASFGFVGSHDGSNPSPASLTLNGASCQIAVTPRSSESFMAGSVLLPFVVK